MTRHARVDETGLLLEWGLSDYGGQGIPVPEDFILPPGRYRWNGQEWVVVPQPDPEAFEVAIHEIFPGQDFVTFAQGFELSWLFYAGLQSRNWPQVQAMLQLALGTGKITQNQYDAIKAAAAANTIPVTL